MITKNIANHSFIGYSGEVTIKLMDNKSRVISQSTSHNRGTSYLFDILTAFITGNTVGQPIPRYIDLMDDSDKSVLTRRLNIVSSPKVIGGTHYAIFNATINYYNFKAANQGEELDLGNLRLDGFRLYPSSSSPNYYMGVKWTGTETGNEASHIKLKSNQNILIEWRLKFDNAVEEVEEDTTPSTVTVAGGN